MKFNNKNTKTEVLMITNKNHILVAGSFSFGFHLHCGSSNKIDYSNYKNRCTSHFSIQVKHMLYVLTMSHSRDYSRD